MTGSGLTRTFFHIDYDFVKLQLHASPIEQVKKRKTNPAIAAQRTAPKRQRAAGVGDSRGESVSFSELVGPGWKSRSHW